MLIRLCAYMLIRLYAYTLICLYADMLIRLYAYTLVCLYAYKLIWLYGYMAVTEGQGSAGVAMSCTWMRKGVEVSKHDQVSGQRQEKGKTSN